MTRPFHTSRRVEFRDTDAAQMAHFSVFFIYMEQAEHELWRHLGLSVMMADDQGPISFPRVGARCDYQEAIRFEDIVDIEVAIVRLGEKSITYEFTFTHNGRPVASGQTTTVCCRLEGKGGLKSIPIPTHVAQKLNTVLVG
ncbi:MAG TPA: thioesterase family protein [Pirellulales bacterium]|nr:thioesterase family protein [Pirellulales bacterium]